VGARIRPELPGSSAWERDRCGEDPPAGQADNLVHTQRLSKARYCHARTETALLAWCMRKVKTSFTQLGSLPYVLDVRIDTLLA